MHIVGDVETMAAKWEAWHRQRPSVTNAEVLRRAITDALSMESAGVKVKLDYQSVEEMETPSTPEVPGPPPTADPASFDAALTASINETGVTATATHETTRDEKDQLESET